MMRSARVVRLVPETERDRSDEDGAVHVVVPKRNVFDVFDPDKGWRLVCHSHKKR